MWDLSIDEDSMQEALADAFRAKGFDVLTAIEAGMHGRFDPEHLDFAVKERPVLCTLNVGDCPGLHARYVAGGREYAGVVMLPWRRHSPGRRAAALAALAEHAGDEGMTNRLEFLSDWL